jgi:phosphomannomutase
MVKSQPMISVAGIRGVVGESLVPEDFLRYVLAYATMVRGKKIVVGTDSRFSREMLRQLVFAGLVSCGYTVTDLGICPTPTVGMMVRELRSDGGIAITASHNPAEWNALKFFNADGEFLYRQQHNRLLRYYTQQRFIRAKLHNLGKVKYYANAVERHVEKVLRAVAVRRIRRRRFRVVVDCCNAAGSVIAPLLLRKLGCHVKAINTNTEALFPHDPEPLAKNLGQLSRATARWRADVGFALDPDADRLAIVDAKGCPLGDERTLALVVSHYLSKRRSPVVVNLSTTRAIDDLGRRYNVRVFRTPIGEAHVTQKLRAVQGKIGGEGNGGVIIPSIHPGRDATTGMAFVLQAMAETNQTIAELNADIPDYALIKRKLRLDRRDSKKLFAAVEREFPSPQKQSRIDGLKLEFPDSWIHLRPSGTEPVMRLFIEAQTQARARELYRRVRQLL